MITEEVVIDQITILEDGQIQVRRDDRVLQDGVIIAHNYHRHVIAPGQPIAGEDVRVRRISAVVHTPEVVRAYRDAIERRG